MAALLVAAGSGLAQTGVVLVGVAGAQSRMAQPGSFIEQAAREPAAGLLGLDSGHIRPSDAASANTADLLTEASGRAAVPDAGGLHNGVAAALLSALVALAYQVRRRERAPRPPRRVVREVETQL